MPTVGWIREGDLDAFYEGTECTPDPSPPRAATFPCPFCAFVFSKQSEFHEHAYKNHRVERPLLIIRHREPSAHFVFRSILRYSDIGVANTSFAKVRIDGAGSHQVSPKELAEIMTNLRQAELELELVNAVERRATPVATHYNFSFRIAENAALKRVEEAFTNILVLGAITREAIGSFLADKRVQGPGKEYATGLADYCLGILLKERPEGERLTTPLSRYRELYGGALEVLNDFQRPLAQLITRIIRFSLNDFGKSAVRTGYWELDTATELLSDPTSGNLPLAIEKFGRRPVCPIDHGTGRMLELVSHLVGQPRWSPILDDECRGVAHSELLDVSDHQKAFAIWAASAWRLGSPQSAREPLTQIAEVYPFSRWASKYLEQAST